MVIHISSRKNVVQGEREMKEKVKALKWFGLAFITCPCHLVVIIPLLAGTAMGGFLTVHLMVTRIALTVLFAICLYHGINKVLGFFEKKKD